MINKTTTHLVNLQTIQGIGTSLSQDLYDLGYREPADLKAKIPEVMYQDLISLRGEHIDQCIICF